MKHLLIPTDFSIHSLNAVYAALEKYKSFKLKITFLHMLDISNDISNMLFLYKRNGHYKLINENFREAYQVLQNRHSSRIDSIHVKFAFGNTTVYLKNWLVGASIDHIIICSDIELTLPSKKSVDMVPLLKKTGFPMDVVPSATKRRADHMDINVISMTPNSVGLKTITKEERYAIEE